MINKDWDRTSRFRLKRRHNKIDSNREREEGMSQNAATRSLRTAALQVAAHRYCVKECEQQRYAIQIGVRRLDGCLCVLATANRGARSLRGVFCVLRSFAVSACADPPPYEPRA